MGIMDEANIKVLNACCELIIRDMNVTSVVDYLIGTNPPVLLRYHANDIMKITDSEERNRKFLTILQQRGKFNAFVHFLEALKNTQQNELYTSILDRSKEPISAKNSDKNQDDKGIALGKLANLPPPGATKIDEALQRVQASLREMYLQSFIETNSFSLPFSPDIENAWVSLTLREDAYQSQPTEGHTELLKNAFTKQKMLIIEGKPAIGKTSLMRRLAYEWAEGKQELSHFSLIIYAEFREVKEQSFESIADLLTKFYSTYEKFFKMGELEDLKLLLSNKRYCEEQNILLLLDGYDESSLDKQCKELNTYIASNALTSPHSNRTFIAPCLFHIVLTTRSGYLSKYRENEGRFVFAEVLGFTTKQQKEKYISNHFLSKVIYNKENIKAVHRLLDNNENLNKLAEAPLFLTFICLVHERIADGTLVELYCNIIWWLIDRYQKNYPDQNIPALFGFQNGSSDKFRTIQDHYLHFPQLHCLCKMALHNIKRNMFKLTDLQQFNLQSIVEQVGLLRKGETHDNSFKIVTSYFFPHRTMQEFLAAFYCFCVNKQSANPLTNNFSNPLRKFEKNFENFFQANSNEIDLFQMTEYEKFLLRIASSEKMPIISTLRKIYFERIANIKLETTFDAFNTSTGLNNELINSLLSQCTNVQNIELRGPLNTTRLARNRVNGTTVHNESTDLSKMDNLSLLSFSALMKLHSLTFLECTLEANSHLSITNCPLLKNLKFNGCVMKSSTNLGIATLPPFETLTFEKCTFEANSQLSFTNYPFLKNLQFWKCKMESGTSLSIATLPVVDTVEFNGCTFEAGSQLSFTDCPSLKLLKFNECEMKSSTTLCIAALPPIETVTFELCTFEDKPKLSFTICPALKIFQFRFCKIKSSSHLGIEILPAIDIVEFHGCTFEANSQLTITNCPSLKLLKFHGCGTESSTNLNIATLPAIGTLNIDHCSIDLATWQSITDQIRNSSVNYLKVALGFDFTQEFLVHLQKCNNVAEMEFQLFFHKLCQNGMLSFNDLTTLQSLELLTCTLEANSQLLFTNCPSLKNLLFDRCLMRSGTNLGIATLPSLDTVEFYRCSSDLATWPSIIDQIRNSSVRCLQLSANYFIKKTHPEFHLYLQKCQHLEEIRIKETWEYSTLKDYDEDVIANLAQIAQKLPRLKSIIILDCDGITLDESRRLIEGTKNKLRALVKKEIQIF